MIMIMNSWSTHIAPSFISRKYIEAICYINNCKGRGQERVKIPCELAKWVSRTFPCHTINHIHSDPLVVLYRLKTYQLITYVYNISNNWRGQIGLLECWKLRDQFNNETSMICIYFLMNPVFGSPDHLIMWYLNILLINQIWAFGTILCLEALLVTTMSTAHFNRLIQAWLQLYQ
jgi:hypothetical protein